MADSNFLGLIAPHIHLCSVVPDGPLVGRWFGADVHSALAWARDENNAGKNIYWTTNIVREGFHNKPTKHDIVRHRMYGADIDDTRSIEGILKFAPSMIIDSGNGMQAIWWAVEPGHNNYADVEAVNRAILHMLNGDTGTFNIDRLFRLPGTVNYPTAKKIARGRQPTFASVVYPNNGNRYTFESMAQAFPPLHVQASREPGAKGEDEWHGDYEPLTLEQVTPKLDKAMMVQLTWERPPTQRSEYVTDCCVLLARAGYEPQIIMGLLMHPDNVALHGTIGDSTDPDRQARRKVAVALKHYQPSAAEVFATPVDTSHLPVLKETVLDTKIKRQGVTKFNGQRFLTPAQAIDVFEGCIYVRDKHQALLPNGLFVGPNQFDATFGGHNFYWDADSAKATKSAWQAWTQNAFYKPVTADYTCFRPELPPHHVVTENGLNLVNVYTPIKTPAKAGDPNPFLQHLAMMLPEPRDQRILLTYMASCVQNPGTKFSWAPVLQGAQGNGKTTLLDILEFCLGERYCHRVRVDKLTRQGVNFNGWIENKLFVGFEEVYSAKRRDFLESIKDMVTNVRLGIEAKGENEYTGDNRANFIFNTNHRDGVPVSNNDRRYAVFFCAQQELSDLNKTGMTEQYFARFRSWLFGDGRAIINYYLRTYACEAEFDPAQLAGRAPRTSSSDVAVRESLGGQEQEILEAIDQGLPGFAGGWVSTVMCKRHLERQGSPTHHRVGRILTGLGYIPHPHLPDGRCNSIVQPDNGKPRLFVKPGSINAGMTEATTIQNSYTRCQIEAATKALTAVMEARK